MEQKNIQLKIPEFLSKCF